MISGGQGYQERRGMDGTLELKQTSKKLACSGARCHVQRRDVRCRIAACKNGRPAGASLHGLS